MPYTFRPAVESDVQAIADIYNAGSRWPAAARPPTLTPRTFDATHAPGWNRTTPPYAAFVTTVPATDAATEGGERIIGFGALSVFYDRAGYDGVTDLAYYTSPPAWQGRGAGTFTLARLLDRGAGTATCARPAASSSPTTRGSIALMHRFGFTQFGLMPASRHRLHRHHAGHVLLASGPVALQ